MGKIKRNILAIGDPTESIISYRDKLFSHSTYLSNNGVRLTKLDYSKIEKKIFPNLESEEVLGILFFPQNFRDKNIKNWIEKDGIFGGNTHLNEIDNYYENIGNLLKEKYGERLKFLNSPSTIKNTRDKRKLKKILLENNIPTSEPFYPKSAEELLDLSSKRGVFVKLPGWGYGQGITYLKNGECKTNLIWDGKVINKDYKISVNNMIKLSKPRYFLEELLKVEPIVEEEIDFMKIEGKKFDLRMYVVGNPYSENSLNIPFWFPRSNDPEKIVTNWCRGGEIKYGSEFREQINKDALQSAKENILKLSKKMGFNYGGVDIIFDKKWNPNFIEAQTDCGLPNPKHFDLLLYTAQKLIEN